MLHQPRISFAACLLAAGLSACGGGSGEPAPAASGLTEQQRSQAATDTAQSGSNACLPIRPFYWEVGDGSSAKASGSIITPTGAVYTADTAMPIASASKWLYSAYVAEVRNGVMTSSDIQFLNFRSGYTSFDRCLPGQTVDSCVAYGTNGNYTAAADGKFLYDGGHMQKHASLNGLGAMDSVALAAELRARLGNDLLLSFSQPQLAGAMNTTAADYAKVLRKQLTGDLQISKLLGSQPVCTNPLTCSQALGSPIPATESWHYSLGHWVEDDPVFGDGTFSSPGSFGFYPWIDANKKYYGILARQDVAGSGDASVSCGRLIRKAWLTGLAQL
jgi:hypothetical protein